MLEIILMGYVVNVVVFLIIVIAMTIIAMIDVINNPEKATFNVMELEALHTKLKKTIQELKTKGMNPTVQEDYLMLIPFSGIILMMSFIWLVVGHGNAGYMYIIINRKLKKLENKLINK